MAFNTEIFMSFCTGVGTLAVTVGLIIWAIRMEIAKQFGPLNTKVAALEKDLSDMKTGRDDHDTKLENKIDELTKKLDMYIQAMQTSYVGKADCKEIRENCPGRKSGRRK